ncbi:MAG: bifunctional acetate--CoA ligase family protein/GNAT family N-acetyltransferase [Limisphaerales bacterium]
MSILVHKRRERGQGFSSSRPLQKFFRPECVAVIGATESAGAVGSTVFQNLVSSGFKGRVYPVNPKRPTIHGHKAFANIAAVPEQVDLAVVVTPAQSVPGVIRECGEVGITNTVIISAGFKEIGEAGADLEKQVLAEAHAAQMRIIGPNCLGVMAPQAGLNATFAKGMARPGNIGFISQSGALCTAILDWSFQANVGFSAFVSIGSMLDVSWGDLIYYLGDDPNTKSIVCYMETIGDARTFLSAAREVALTKPIIVIKVGETEAAARAVISHTGSLTGSNDVLDAAFRRVGVLRVRTIEELFDMADVLAKQPRPKGNRLAMLTNAGGPGALATDMLVRKGGKLAELSKEGFQKLNSILPPFWSRNNPVDVLGDANAERYGKALEVLVQEANADGNLVILTPQDMTEPTETAEALRPFAKSGKPLLGSWMGGVNVEEGRKVLTQAGIPSFDYPDQAARAFVYMWQYSENLRSIYETPTLSRGKVAEELRGKAEKIIAKARKEGRTVLTEVESHEVLHSYGIPTVQTKIAKNENEAVEGAKEIGFPVVLKLYSRTITHKTDVGGVLLNIRSAEEVRKGFLQIRASVTEKAGAEHFDGVTIEPMINTREGYELILGSSLDPQFGPVMLFGTGGQLVEVFKDRSLGLPPLNTTLARRVVEKTKIFEALKGVRGRKPVDLAALDELLVRFSQLIVEQRWIKEVDINPLLASANGLIALDARVVLHAADVKEGQLPKIAIRPYPMQYVHKKKLKDGSSAVIRPILPEDEPLMIKFHESLSEASVYYRYFGALKLEQRISHERLARICFNDYDREIALVVERQIPGSEEHEILGVARVSKVHGTTEAEFAIIITDKWQGQGLGVELTKRVQEIARGEGVELLRAVMLPENREMQRLAEKAGFEMERTGEGEVIAELEVAAA